MIDDEALHRAALQALGENGDERAREALAEGAVVSDASSRAHWESSGGPMQGRTVRLGVPLPWFARVIESPVALDALTRAFAVAVAELAEGEALVGLEVRWGPVEERDAGPYRTPARRGVGATTAASVHAAVEEYLRLEGRDGAADAVARGVVRGALAEERSDAERFEIALAPDDAGVLADVERAMDMLLGYAAAYAATRR